jgi:hypothetical protein
MPYCHWHELAFPSFTVTEWTSYFPCPLTYALVWGEEQHEMCGAINIAESYIAVFWWVGEGLKCF